jgi:hypothetical protein
VEQRDRGVSGSVAARQRGKEEGTGGGSGRRGGVQHGAGVSWSLVPTGGRPAAARVWRGRAMCAARALSAEQRGERDV